MSAFDDRETAFEAKFAHDAEMVFRAEARRNRHVGTWAAGLLGRSENAVFDYVKELIRVDFQEPGDEDVIRKLVADLDGKASEEEIRKRMREAMAKAKAELLDEA